MKQSSSFRPTDVPWKTATRSLHLIRCLFSIHARKRVMGKTAKGRDRTSSRAFRSLVKSLSAPRFVPPIFILQLKSEDGKNLGLEKNFSTSKRHLATGLRVWKKEEEEKDRNSRKGKDFQTGRRIKEPGTAFGKWSKDEYDKKKNQTCRQSLESGRDWVCSFQISGAHVINTEMYSPSACVREGRCKTEMVKVLLEHQETELSSSIAQLKEKFNKVWSPFISSHRSVKPLAICTAQTFTPHLPASSLLIFQRKADFITAPSEFDENQR